MYTVRSCDVYALFNHIIHIYLIVVVCLVCCMLYFPVTVTVTRLMVITNIKMYNLQTSWAS